MKEEALSLLKQVLEIRSVNGTDDEGAVAEFLRGYFQEHGIEAKTRRIDEKHANVIAFVPGRDESRTMVWNGHLDTVPFGNEEKWATDPRKAVERDGRLYARGASDMKSGLCAMVYALTHLTGKPACNIRFIGTCDEEKGGLGSEIALSDQLMDGTDRLLVGEPTDMKLGIAQKGCLWLEILTKGQTSHGAYPKEGANAISCAIRIAAEIKRFVEAHTHAVLGSSTAQITMISGGVANNMLPDQCRIVMDIRMTPGLSTAEVIRVAEQALCEEQKREPRFQAKFTPLTDRRAIEIAEEHPFVKKLSASMEQYHYPAEVTGINFYTDASYLDRRGEKDILLFGPGDPALAHQPNEYVEIQKYTDAVEILSHFALNA